MSPENYRAGGGSLITAQNAPRQLDCIDEVGEIGHDLDDRFTKQHVAAPRAIRQ
jgi:hypothetical protein